MSAISTHEGLGRRVLQAATYLSFRQILGLALSAGGMVVIARLVGPSAYGIYAIVTGIYAAMIGAGELGVSAYLIRLPRDPVQSDFDEAFTFLLGMGLALWVVSIGIAVLLTYWIAAADIERVALVVFAMIVPRLLSAVPGAILERTFNYGAIAKIELGTQIFFQLVGLTAAWLGLGVWAPVIANWSLTATGFAATLVAAGYRPALRWNGIAVRDFVAFGVPYAGAAWIWQLRWLVNSLVVGHFAGPATAGAVAICVRIVDALTTAKAVSMRIAVPALGTIHEDTVRTARVIGEGAQLQVFALGLPLLGFGVVGPYILDLLLGRNWTSVVQLFPFVATSALMLAVYGLFWTALGVHGRNWSAVVFTGANVLTFFAASLLLIPKFGILGYGISEVFALPSYLLLYRLCSRIIPGVQVRPSFFWAAGIATALFWRYLGVWALAGAIAPLALRGSREALRGSWVRTRTLLVRAS